MLVSGNGILDIRIIQYRVPSIEYRVSNMELSDLTEKMHAFVRSKGWYEADTKRPQTPRNLAISLSLEAAEILEHFQWREGRLTRPNWPANWPM